MQSGIAPADRKLLYGAGLIAVVLIAGTVAFAPAESQSALEPPSTYSSGPGGARAAFLLLVDMGYPVRRWEDPPAGLASVPSHSVLIIAEPTVMPTARERRTIVEFVQNGGQLLFCGAALSSFFTSADLQREMYGAGKREFTASFPGYIARGAARIEIRPEAYWGNVGPSQLALYGDGQRIAVVAWRLGAGQVLWWAGATPLTNAGLPHAGNLNLFLNSVSVPASVSGVPRAIYWDEYFHGERASLWAYFYRTPVFWGVVQIGLGCLCVLFAFARRSGPTVLPAAVSRLSPLEFVDTMGGLYQRAGAQSLAVAVSYRHLRLELTRRLGLPAAVPAAELASAARERLGLGNDLARTLADAALADTRPLPAAQALALVQRLAAYTDRLNAPRLLPPEKN